MGKLSVYDYAQMSLLACFIIVTGSLKIPTGIPGSEFQLSAPIAVAIAVVFGFKRYFIAGLIASFLLFALGVHTIINVEVAITFRLIVIMLLFFLGTSLPVLIIAGPVATTVARFALSFTLDIPFTPLFLTAIPGMIITAITVWPLTKLLRMVHQRVGVSGSDNKMV